VLKIFLNLYVFKLKKNINSVCLKKVTYAWYENLICFNKEGISSNLEKNIETKLLIKILFDWYVIISQTIFNIMNNIELI